MEQLSFGQNMTAVSAGGGLFASGPVRSLSDDSLMERTVRREPEPQGNVTEIILPEGQVENFQLLLPMLTQLNREKRWLAWIDPPQALVAKWQKQHGIVAGEILVLRSTAEHPATELAEKALGAGTCHAVVMWTSRLPKAVFRKLQAASANGNSHGVVLRQR
jgi:cell division inhibitor SulA